MPIYDYQREVYDELRETYMDFRSEDWKHLPLRPVWHSLIVASSGTGKNHLVRQLSEEFRVPLLTLSAANWILQGCSERAGIPTWRLILRKLATWHQGIIFVDEACKLSDNSTWTTFLRTELFSLLDLKIPDGLKTEEEEEGDILSRSRAEIARQAAEKVLRDRVFLVAAGAFQGFWENDRSCAIGFGREFPEPTRVLSKNELAQWLPRELTNRFRHILTISPPDRQGYIDMLSVAAGQMPSSLRASFLQIGLSDIDRALTERQGARFVESVLMRAIRRERQQSEKATLFPPPEEVQP